MSNRGNQGESLHRAAIAVLVNLLKKSGYENIETEPQHLKEVVPDVTATLFCKTTLPNGQKISRHLKYAFQIETGQVNENKQYDLTKKIMQNGYTDVKYIHLNKINNYSNLKSTLSKLESFMEEFI